MSTESLTEAPATVEVVYVGQEQPESWDAAVYLCGPTPTDPEEPSWRPSAVAALRAVGRGSRRTGGERAVPLVVWRSERFQRWYATLRSAGCRLLDARLEWYEPAPDGDPAWLLTVMVAPGDGAVPSVHRLPAAQGQGMLM
ncbi:hypothetical protein ACFUAC_06495 [Streptomyces sp. NPDC057148]|uniref:hypothetical protein n=1 Tax=unclassified Streptomyces TaxID=2593676 RepID=UPI00363AE53F